VQRIEKETNLVAREAEDDKVLLLIFLVEFFKTCRHRLDGRSRLSENDAATGLCIEE